MKILIVKNNAMTVDVKKESSFYNTQEVGLAIALNQQGVQCDIVYWGKQQDGSIDYAYDGDNKTFKIHLLKARKILNMLIYKNLIKLTDQYDIILSLEYQMIQSWILAKKIPNKLVIYNGSYYSDFNKRFNLYCKFVDMFFLPTYLKNNIRFVTKSKLSEDFLRGKGIKAVATLGVGLNLDYLDVSIEQEHPFVTTLRNEIAQGYKLLLYIGRIEPRRNIDFLLDIITGLATKEKVKLVVIGTRGPNKYKQRIFERMQELIKANTVIYLEKIEQKYVKSIYQLSSVFLLPTYYEIFGMVLLEAMYYGIPVVSTPNGGACLLMKNKESGFIVQNNDYTLWEKNIVSILHNADMASTISSNAHQIIISSYTWQHLARKLINIISLWDK